MNGGSTASAIGCLLEMRLSTTEEGLQGDLWCQVFEEPRVVMLFTVQQPGHSSRTCVSGKAESHET